MKTIISLVMSVCSVGFITPETHRIPADFATRVGWNPEFSRLLPIIRSKSVITNLRFLLCFVFAHMRNCAKIFYSNVYKFLLKRLSYE